MKATPENKAKLPEQRQFGGMTGALKARARDFTIASIINITTKEEELDIMKIEELRSKSAVELRDIYNGLVEKQVKRFKDRVEAEKRTAEALKANGEWEGALPGADGKKAAGNAASKKAAAALKETAKAASKKAVSKHTKEVRPRGAPRVNLIYIAIKHDNRMNENSGRTKVYKFILEQGAKGIDREAIENHFLEDETVNVKSSLDYLVKFSMMSTKELK